MADTPPPGSTPTCDSAGILGPIINVIASIEAMEAIKILSGRGEAISRQLTVVDLWENRVRQVGLDGLREAVDCAACEGREFPWLHGERGSHTAVLCGRNAVQLTFPEQQRLSLEELSTRLSTVGQVRRNAYLLRLEVGEHQLTVFPDGRAIVGGTEDIAEARTLYAQYIGN